MSILPAPARNAAVLAALLLAGCDGRSYLERQAAEKSACEQLGGKATFVREWYASYLRCEADGGAK
jgi:hypothetical protein